MFCLSVPSAPTSTSTPKDKHKHIVSRSTHRITNAIPKRTHTHSKLIDATLLIQLITVITLSQTKPFLMKINGNSFAQRVYLRMRNVGHDIGVLAKWNRSQLFCWPCIEWMSEFSEPSSSLCGGKKVHMHPTPVRIWFIGYFYVLAHIKCHISQQITDHSIYFEVSKFQSSKFQHTSLTFLLLPYIAAADPIPVAVEWP